MDATILAALQQLSAIGKQPTVALLKSKVGRGFPLPVLIDAIKQYKTNPDAITVTTTQAANHDVSLADLQRQMKQMQQQIDQLTATVAKLTQSQ
ncbi:hypothetical protein [Ferrimonas lipolytica]|uniref:KfrA N-terminal DNA-binding domain-containing protein n=1 Tax=Ferrimonas lipolytica TaxID=2724191 RepID=A0A6H1UE88_9GAMM|nr:hypothetical protein [Ferrimonas lipolytica]QIZ77405.1 hypothetical protein HER31_11245 [Ferrimonas lipolytica]